VRTLKKIRRANGLSQHALARKSGVPRWRIAFAETGRLTLTDEERSRILVALARYIGKNVEAMKSGLGIGSAVQGN